MGRQERKICPDIRNVFKPTQEPKNVNSAGITEYAAILSSYDCFISNFYVRQLAERGIATEFRKTNVSRKFARECYEVDVSLGKRPVKTYRGIRFQLVVFSNE